MLTGEKANFKRYKIRLYLVIILIQFDYLHIQQKKSSIDQETTPKLRKVTHPINRPHTAIYKVMYRKGPKGRKTSENDSRS